MRAPIGPDVARLHPGFLVDGHPARGEQELIGVLEHRHDGRHARRHAVGGGAFHHAIVVPDRLLPGVVVLEVLALQRRRRRGRWRAPGSRRAVEGQEPDAAPVGQLVQGGVAPLGEGRASSRLQALRNRRAGDRTHLGHRREGQGAGQNGGGCGDGHSGSGSQPGPSLDARGSAPRRSRLFTLDESGFAYCKVT